MSDKAIRTETIDGTDIPIYMADDGQFMAREQGKDTGGWVKAESLKKLIDKLRKQLRTASLRLDIPMTLLSSGRDSWRSKHKQPTVEPVTLTGVHARTHKPLITYANGEKGTYSSYDDGVLTRRLSEEEAAGYIAAVKLAHETADALNTLVEETLKLPGGSVEKFVRDYVSTHSKAATGDLDGLEVANNDD